MIDGTEFFDNNDEQDEYISSYGSILDTLWDALNILVTREGIDRFYVIDRKVYGDKVLEYFNKRTLESFLKEHNESLLNRYIRECESLF